MTTALHVELASRFARQVPSAKATSIRSTPTPASTAAHAPRIAPTRQSAKANDFAIKQDNNRAPTKRRRGCFCYKASVITPQNLLKALKAYAPMKFNHERHGIH